MRVSVEASTLSVNYILSPIIRFLSSFLSHFSWHEILERNVILLSGYFITH